MNDQFSTSPLPQQQNTQSNKQTKWEGEIEEREKSDVLEGRDDIVEDVDPWELDGGGLARIIGRETVRDGAGSVIGLNRCEQQRKWHQLRRALHLRRASMWSDRGFGSFSRFFAWNARSCRAIEVQERWRSNEEAVRWNENETMCRVYIYIILCEDSKFWFFGQNIFFLNLETNLKYCDVIWLTKKWYS